MTQIITGEQFWNELDLAKGRNTVAWLSEVSGVPQSLLVSTRQRRSFLSFENTFLLCRALSIDMNSFIDCDELENDRLIHPVNIESPTIGRQFWVLLDKVLEYRGWSWRYVALKCNIATTTISSAKSARRTLPFDVTLKLLRGMDITPDALAMNISLSEGASALSATRKSEVDIKRDRLVRTIKRLDEIDLDNVIEYVEFIRSKTK